MKLPGHLLAGALALAALLPTGCTSAPRPGQVEGDPIEAAVTHALTDLSRKMTAQASDGWPAHVPLSSSEPRRPVLRIARLVNRSRSNVDMAAVEHRIARALIDNGSVVVAANEREREEAMDEQAYQESASGAAAPEVTEDLPGLMLVGELTDDVKQVDDELEHKVIFLLTVTDVVKRAALVKAQGEATQVSEAR